MKTIIKYTSITVIILLFLLTLFVSCYSAYINVYQITKITPKELAYLQKIENRVKKMEMQMFVLTTNQCNCTITKKKYE